MATYIPSGRLSAVSCGEQRIEIQTEFSQHPQPRVATTISISGRVLHKVQKNWDRGIVSIEDMHEAENVINSQHDEVTALVKEHGEIMVRQSQQKAIEHSNDDLLNRVEQIPAVRRAFVLSRDGEIHNGAKVSREAKALAAIITSMADLLLGMSQVTNLGDCRDCVLDIGSYNLLLIPVESGYLAAVVNRDVKKKAILEELHQVVSKL
jgi:predicted regulator of Ras-like GTPase activity (Roadblock/LC7/MglB family)